MPEHEPVTVNCYQAGLLGLDQPVGAQTTRCRSTADDGEAPGVVRGSDEKELLRLARQPPQTLQEDAFDLLRERQGFGQRLSPSQLGLG